MKDVLYQLVGYSSFLQCVLVSGMHDTGFYGLHMIQLTNSTCQILIIPEPLTFVPEIKSNFLYFIVGSTDQESSQELRTWFSEHFFAPKLVA